MSYDEGRLFMEGLWPISIGKNYGGSHNLVRKPGSKSCGRKNQRSGGLFRICFAAVVAEAMVRSRSQGRVGVACRRLREKRCLNE